MIWKYEMSKLYRSPVIWILVCICLGFNILFSLSELEGRDEELRTVYEAFQNGEVSEEFLQQCMSLYDGLDMNNVKEIREEMADYHPLGSYGAFLDQIYDDLNERVEEIRENGEAEQIIYPGCFLLHFICPFLRNAGRSYFLYLTVVFRVEIKEFI